MQNEILNIVGNAVQSKIITQIKSAKYFAVILDCTPNISHQEQMSLTLRYVSDDTFPEAPVEELETTPEFQSKRLQKTKKQFNYKSNDEPIVDPKEAYGVECFNQGLDKVKLYLETRFEQLKKHTDLYGLLGKFQNCRKKELEKHAAGLEIALTDHKLSQREESVDLIKATDFDRFNLKNKKDIFYPDLPPAVRPIPHEPEVSVSKPPESLNTPEHSKSDCEDSDSA
ncbi:hypothetical protein ILUMI_04371 [Ignelater luminosus]|uniref:DUF4371 domain-containing protein n=1 Tax=Ignelater luminosus TaxID=2038154 RepID=A0A8K0GJ39_IGNLU|nr:hypothetical protein ILUMI_04371 [Ignelater luminosus]